MATGIIQKPNQKKAAHTMYYQSTKAAFHGKCASVKSARIIDLRKATLRHKHTFLISEQLQRTQNVLPHLRYGKIAVYQTK
jgi:hypothetical protein